ncbi:hypothetical protein [Saccharopolyspora sp. CA-218241]|uniref:hypothetical protein n=1 Tax=Saccharopolyspora sp. CA-218241 TaxID=3240027 RepID=UPI003D99C929
MGALWMQVLTALSAGVVCAGMVAVVLRTRSAPAPVPDDPGPAFGDPAAPALPDPWSVQVQRCEQAVHRARCAVEAISSASARHALQAVVRRMDAELPSARALAELGRGLDRGGRAGDTAVLDRVVRQLDDAVERFGAITGEVLDAVVDLVADRDLDRLHERVLVLREQFPLLRPMSSLVSPAPSPAAPKALVPLA